MKLTLRSCSVPLLVAFACSAPPPTQSGFLSDYDRMHEFEGGDGALVWAMGPEVPRRVRASCVFEPLELWVDSLVLRRLVA